MSRNVKRVPMDFSHEGTWPGYEAEPSYEPPTGDGWQMWEDVSEGSPVSPVFATSEELAQWIVEAKRENGQSDYDCCIEAARAFIEQGWAPTGIGTGFGFFTGVQSAAGIAAHIAYMWSKHGIESLPAGTRIRHKETGVEGKVEHRLPPDRHWRSGDDEYYVVTWDRMLPTMVEPTTGDDAHMPFLAGCRIDGFEPFAEVTA